MMQEFNDKTFGAIRESSELLKSLVEDRQELARTRAVHFGTKAELEARRQQAEQDIAASERLDAIERKLNVIIAHLGIALPGEILVVPGSEKKEAA